MSPARREGIVMTHEEGVAKLAALESAIIREYEKRQRAEEHIALERAIEKAQRRLAAARGERIDVLV